MTTLYISANAINNLPKRRDFDFYPTPLSVAMDALEYLPEDFKPQCLLDPGAGTGVWGRAARLLWPFLTITGVDIRPVFRPKEYNFWLQEDYLLTDKTPAFDLIVGNPPYKYTEQFVRHSLGMLENGGHLVFLLRLSFLEGQERRRGLWREYPPRFVVVCSKRVSFTGDGQTNATAYAYFIWQKGWKGETVLKWTK